MAIGKTHPTLKFYLNSASQKIIQMVLWTRTAVLNLFSFPKISSNQNHEFSTNENAWFLPLWRFLLGYLPDVGDTSGSLYIIPSLSFSIIFTTEICPKIFTFCSHYFSVFWSKWFLKLFIADTKRGVGRTGHYFTDAGWIFHQFKCWRWWTSVLEKFFAKSEMIRKRKYLGTYNGRLFISF